MSTIPTWRNIGGVSLDLSQRATQAAGNEMNDAFSVLQNMAAQQRQLNVNQEKQDSEANLLKFQQAARNMSLGELDALGKAAPEVLMDRFGLNKRNISKAVDFANQQDDVLRQEANELYQFQENQRKQVEAPIRAMGSTLLAEAEASGDFSKFTAFMQSEAGKLQDSSDLFAGMTAAKNRLLERERSDIQFNQNQQDRSRMLNKIKAEEQLNALTSEATLAMASSDSPEIKAKAFAKTLDHIQKNPTISAAAALQTMGLIIDSAEKAVAPDSEQAKQIAAAKFSGEVAVKAKEMEIQSRLAQAKQDYPVDIRLRPLMEEAEKGTSPEKVLDTFISSKVKDNVNFETRTDAGGQELKAYLPELKKVYSEKFGQELPGKLLEIALDGAEISGSWFVGDPGVNVDKIEKAILELGTEYQKTQSNFGKLQELELKYTDELNQTKLNEAKKVGELVTGTRKMNKEQFMQLLRMQGNIPFNEVRKNPQIQ